MDYNQASLQARTKNGGQIYTGLKPELNSVDDLSTHYSPGIAEPCRVIAEDKQQSKILTQRRNTVAVISDGSAVLGLGNIGPEAALPVMEGKCMLLKKFGNVDGVPIVLDTQDTDELVETIVRLAPTFGGINLEDISAPRCFEIERRVAEKVDIPVFHDDQHGTAMVCLAALINSLKVVEKEKGELKVVISGAGAAGIAIATLLREWGVVSISMTDSKGVVDCGRGDLNDAKTDFCVINAGETLEEALKGADVFIGVSKAGILKPAMIQNMNTDPIIFALANPIPEIMPEEALAAGAKIVATGRSDYPNQINNVLIFPGLFRGLLDSGISVVTPELKLKVAEALASVVENPTAERVIPSVFDERVMVAVSESIPGPSFSPKGREE